MGSEEHVLFRVEEGVGVITLNRPERLNAVSWEMASDLASLLGEIRFRDEVRVLVLTGAGRAFCAGGDAEFVSGSGDRPCPASPIRIRRCRATRGRRPPGRLRRPPG
jgi:2-(1,2-epoxy-1,2-dihydrophenyl)acetyl-CoA isomerase